MFDLSSPHTCVGKSDGRLCGIAWAGAGVRVPTGKGAEGRPSSVLREGVCHGPIANVEGRKGVIAGRSSLATSYLRRPAEP